jgi:hypothetical protein
LEFTCKRILLRTRILHPTPAFLAQQRLARTGSNIRYPAERRSKEVQLCGEGEECPDASSPEGRLASLVRYPCGEQNRPSSSSETVLPPNSRVRTGASVDPGEMVGKYMGNGGKTDVGPGVLWDNAQSVLSPRLHKPGNPGRYPNHIPNLRGPSTDRAQRKPDKDLVKAEKGSIQVGLGDRLAKQQEGKRANTPGPLCGVAGTRPCPSECAGYRDPPTACDVATSNARTLRRNSFEKAADLVSGARQEGNQYRVGSCCPLNSYLDDDSGQSG